MFNIKTKPSTIIRQNYNNFSKYCHELGEPVLITLSGEADLVVMSYEVFQEMKNFTSSQSNSSIDGNHVYEDEDLF